MGKGWKRLSGDTAQKKWQSDADGFFVDGRKPEDQSMETQGVIVWVFGLLDARVGGYPGWAKAPG